MSDSTRNNKRGKKAKVEESTAKKSFSCHLKIVAHRNLFRKLVPNSNNCANIICESVHSVTKLSNASTEKDSGIKKFAHRVNQHFSWSFHMVVSEDISSDIFVLFDFLLTKWFGKSSCWCFFLFMTAIPPTYLFERHPCELRLHRQ